MRRKKFTCAHHVATKPQIEQVCQGMNRVILLRNRIYATNVTSKQKLPTLLRFIVCTIKTPSSYVICVITKVVALQTCTHIKLSNMVQSNMNVISVANGLITSVTFCVTRPTMKVLSCSATSVICSFIETTS